MKWSSLPIFYQRNWPTRSRQFGRLLGGVPKRLFTKFKDTPKSSFRYQVDDVFQWAIENRAEFAEVRFEGERQWSRDFVAGWQGWDALERLGMVDQRVPKLRKDDDAAKFTALIEQNRWLVEPGAMDMLREAFEREARIDDEGLMPVGHVTLEPRHDAFDIVQLARDARPVWPWQI